MCAKDGSHWQIVSIILREMNPDAPDRPVSPDCGSQVPILLFYARRLVNKSLGCRHKSPTSSVKSPFPKRAFDRKSAVFIEMFHYSLCDNVRIVTNYL